MTCSSAVCASPFTADAVTMNNKSFFIALLLFRERIRTDLEMCDLSRGSFAPFGVPGDSRSIRCPNAATFPSGLWIVDAPVHAPGQVAHRVGNAHNDRLA